MAIYPALFGHVELPDLVSARPDRDGLAPFGIRVVRPLHVYTEQRRKSPRRRP
jgi:hypothetical protein